MTAAYWLGWICGFACGAVGMQLLHEVMKKRRKRWMAQSSGPIGVPMSALDPMAVKPFGTADDAKAVMKSMANELMAAIDAEECDDPDCPVCSGSGGFLSINDADQIARTVLPDKDTKH